MGHRTLRCVGGWAELWSGTECCERTHRTYERRCEPDKCSQPSGEQIAVRRRRSCFARPEDQTYIEIHASEAVILQAYLQLQKQRAPQSPQASHRLSCTAPVFFVCVADGTEWVQIRNHRHYMSLPSPV